jgi:hypothetical protein
VPIIKNLQEAVSLYDLWDKQRKSRRRWWKRVNDEVIPYKKLVDLGKSDFPLKWLKAKGWVGKEMRIKQDSPERLKIRRVRLLNILKIVQSVPELEFISKIEEVVKGRREHERAHFITWGIYVGPVSVQILAWMSKHWDWAQASTGSLFDLLSYIGVAAKKWPEYFENMGLDAIAMVDMKNLLGWILEPDEIEFDFAGKAMSLMDNPIRPGDQEFWEYFKRAVDELVGAVKPVERKNYLTMKQWWQAGGVGTPGSARGEKVVIDDKKERISKNGLVGIYTYEEALAKMETGNNTVVPVWKQDRGKGRVIWSSDWESTIGLSYVRYALQDPELKVPGYALGLRPYNKLQLTNSMMSQNTWRMPLDIDSFDSHFTQTIRRTIQCTIAEKWIAGSGEEVSRAWNNYVRRMSRVTVLVQVPINDPQREQWEVLIKRMATEGKIANVVRTRKNIQFDSNNGLFSGQVDTSMMGTIFTLASQLATRSYIIDKFGAHYDMQETEVAAGDDTELTFRSFRSALLYFYAVQAMGLRVNPTKFWIDIDRTEFLRVLVTEKNATGYISRAVGAMIERQPGKPTELTQEEKILGIFDAIRTCTLRRRPGSDVYVHAFNRRLLRLMGSILGVNKLINIPTDLGGLGIGVEYASLGITGQTIQREVPTFKSSSFISDNAYGDAERLRKSAGVGVDVRWVGMYMDRVKQSVDNSELSKKLREDYRQKYDEHTEERHSYKVVCDPQIAMVLYHDVMASVEVLDDKEDNDALRYMDQKRPVKAGTVKVDDEVMFVRVQDMTMAQKWNWLVERRGAKSVQPCRTYREKWEYATSGIGLTEYTDRVVSPDLAAVLKRWFLSIVEPRWTFSRATYKTMVTTTNCVWHAVLPTLLLRFRRLNY